MKKIIIAFISIFTMMICIAQPLFAHAVTQLSEDDSYVYDYDYATSQNPNNWFSSLQSDLNAENLSYDPLYYIRIRHGNNNESRTTTVFFTEGEFDFTDNVLTLSNLKLGSNNYARLRNCFRASYMSSSSNSSNNITDIYIDFTNHMCKYTFTGGSLSDQYHVSDRDWYKINTNCPDGIPNNNTLNVFVDFSPDLIGNVDRQITATDGTKSMRKDLAMQVINQSNFPIQYDMRIYKVNQSSSRDWSLNPETFATQFDSDSVSYDDDPVFIYYKNEWVYTTNYDSESTFWDLEPVKENKGASWHYLPANSQDIVLFNFTQINLDENVDYYVEVRAVRNDYGCSSEKIVYSASDDPAESEYKQIQGDDIVTVYHEQFKMINYSDVVYNPNEDSNGVLPYNGKNGIVSRNTYQYGRNARDNGNGNIDYTARNLYTDPKSWYNQQYNRVVSNHTSNASSGSVPSNITNLFDSFMKFVSYVFLRFPANMQTIYVYGFVSVVVLGIVLKVIK